MAGIVLDVIVMLVISMFVATKFNEIAQMKGHDGYFGWCFFLGIVGWLMVVALPDRSAHRRIESGRYGGRRRQNEDGQRNVSGWNNLRVK